jgi:hypothetical protein
MGLAVLAIDLLLVAWMAARVVRDARVDGRRRRLYDLGVVTLPSTPAPRGARIRKALGAAIAVAVVMLGVSRVPPAPAALTGASSAIGPSAPASWGAPAANDPSGDGGHVDLPKPHAPVDPSETSSSSVGSAPAAGSDAGGAGAPSTVAAVSTSTTTIRLEWASVPNASHYGVERSTEPAGWEPVGTTDGDETSYVDDSLAAGTTYYYRVVAFVAGEPSASDAVSATTPPDLSTPPQFVAVTASTTSVDLVWTDIDGELGYRIERSADGLTGWVGIGTTGRDVTAFTDSGLTAATTYSYRVIAVGADGESPPSAISTVATDAADSSQPTTRDPSSDQAEPAG